MQQFRRCVLSHNAWRVATLWWSTIGEVNRFQSVRAISNVVRYEARATGRGVSNRHCQGRLQYTVRNRRIVETCNLASANNTMRRAALTFITSWTASGEPVDLNHEEKSEDDFVCRMNNNGLSKRYLYLLASVSHSPCPNRLDSHFNGVSQWVTTSPMKANERLNTEIRKL